MAYIVKDKNTKLTLELSTNQSNYSLIRLNTYINDNTTKFKTYTPTVVSRTDGSHILTFIIKTKEYNIDDVISKFELEVNSSTHLWQTHEGITWLLDGQEYSTKNSNTETFQFNEQGNHTIQAVFTGNDSLEMASTDKTPIIITQSEINESGSLDNSGAYEIQFVNKNLKSLNYKDGTKIEFILLKGGVPVTTGNRNIEVITPKDIWSVTLDNKGKGGFTNTRNWKVGTYTIGAFYQDENNHTITRTTKKITINKGTPKLTDNSASKGNFVPDSKYKAVLKFNGNPLAKTKVTLYVNGKSFTLTTDKYGAIQYKFDKTGTFKLKTVYKGNSNLKKVELSATITVVKKHG